MSEEASSLIFSSAEEEDTISSDSNETDQISKLQSRVRDYIVNFVKPPAAPPHRQSLDFYLLQACKFLISYHVYNGPAPKPAIGDNEAQIKRAATHMCLERYYMQFFNRFDKIKETIVEQIYADIDAATLGEDHPVKDVSDLIMVHKELHVRRLKTDPAKKRTKMSAGETRSIVYDPITKDPCRFNKVDKVDDGPLTMKYYRQLSSMKYMIFIPLPSDFNSEAIDPLQGNMEHRLSLLADELQGNVDPKYDMEAPFGIVMAEEWSTFYSILHNIIHFQHYLHTYISGAIPKDFVADPDWDTTWEQLAGVYHNRPITKFARKVNITPDVICRITEMRDFLRFVMDFETMLTK